MPYCYACGEKLPENAAFCPKCGVKAVGASGTGAAATPADELREAFTRMSVEMERAFNIAAREVQEAFQSARSNVQKTVFKEPINCPSCGTKNPGSAVYCYKCGTKILEPSTEQKDDRQPL